MAERIYRGQSAVVPLRAEAYHKHWLQDVTSTALHAEAHCKQRLAACRNDDMRKEDGIVELAQLSLVIQ